MGVLDGAAFEALGTREPDILTEAYTLPQRIGRLMRDAGLSGILVPAAIRTVARFFPTFRLRRDYSDLTVVAPASGRNLVIFPDPTGAVPPLEEIERYTCILQGLRAGE